MESENAQWREAEAERLRGRAPLLLCIELLLVGVGGALGTLGRYVLTIAVPAPQNAALLIANLSGACMLGVLVALLAGRHKRLQLFLGTGVCAGFTTYGAFAVAIEHLTAAQPLSAVVFALGTVIAGVASVTFGVWVGGRIRRDRGGDPVPALDKVAP